MRYSFKQAPTSFVQTPFSLLSSFPIPLLQRQAMTKEFNREKHIRYFKSNLSMLPTPYTQTETNRMTLAFFALGGLSLLGELDNNVSDENKRDWIEWIYAQQVLPTGQDPDPNEAMCGFRGSSWSGRPFDPHTTTLEFQHYDSSHIANTYTALLNLLLLGDDLSRVNRKAIVRTLSLLQSDDGSIAPTSGSLERDARFVFCACAISYILNDWSGLDVEKSMLWIRRLQSYEHGIAQCPNEEAHGGSTFCGVAALCLMNKTKEGIVDKEGMIQWCLSRQITGFQGRPNKLPDACYCFWIGAALKMLGGYELINHEVMKTFLFDCQPKMGGFGKDPESFPDLLHSYMGIAALSLSEESSIQPIEPSLNVPASAYQHLKENTVFWKGQ
ncbi:geranylgeranyltransferase type I beta-subunit-like protein [Choanephora cucurbitarum]|nr:geranylgeranyltransferase type I beta-subunit-like protein [Choanephora cucurbitarum]KAI8351503.1 geranylgeranyltransferase type I beta-subunit-like protein [Choanephora cucurbitarum]